MTILLTGASGFLGSALAAHWGASGHTVRDASGCRLGQALPGELLQGCDAMVHAAHDFAADAAERNRNGTIAWFDAAARAGVRQQVFLSSFSARGDSSSRYGLTKFAIEEYFLAQGATVARPGLVAGPGGMFARLVDSLVRFRVAPLVYPDARTVAVVALEDLLRAMTVLLERQKTGAWNLLAPDLLTGREFADGVWRARGMSGLVIGVPAGVAIGVLRMAGAANALDSVRAQMTNVVPIHRSDLVELLGQPTATAEAVERAVREVPK